MTLFVRFTATSETGIPYAIGLRLNGLRINGFYCICSSS